MSRYVSPRTSEMTAEQRRLRDVIVDGPRGKAGAVLTDADDRLTGPFGPMVLDPELGDHLQAIGLGVQANQDLSPVLRELVILRVVAERDCTFEWNAHVAKARGLGASDAAISAVRTGATAPDLDEASVAVLAYVQLLLDHGAVDDAAYDAVRSTAGPGAVFAATVIVGYYELLANLFTAFALPRPEPVSV